MQVARDGAEALDLFDAGPARPGAARRDAADGLGHRRVPGAPPAQRPCRSSWSRPRRPRSTRSSASRSAPTTTSPSRTGSASWWPACGRCSGAGRRGADTVGEAHDVLRVDDIELDPDRHEVRIRGDLVSLPLKEFELLGPALENAGRVLPRATLIDRVWGTDYVGDTKTLDVHVKRLRSKVEDDPVAPARGSSRSGASATSSPAAAERPGPCGPVAAPGPPRWPSGPARSMGPVSEPGPEAPGGAPRRPVPGSVGPPAGPDPAWVAADRAERAERLRAMRPQPRVDVQTPFGRLALTHVLSTRRRRAGGHGAGRLAVLRRRPVRCPVAHRAVPGVHHGPLRRRRTAHRAGHGPRAAAATGSCWSAPRWAGPWWRC